MGIRFIVYTAIFMAIAIRVLKFFLKRQEFRKIIDKIPGPRAYPVIGTALTFLKVRREDRCKWFVDLSNQYEGGIFRLWLGEKPEIHVTKAQHLESIITSTENITKGFVYDFLICWLGNSLLLGSGEKWHRNRKLITPTFHFNILEESSKIMSEKAVILNRCIEAEVEKNPGKPIDVSELLIKTALDIICEAAMGVRTNTQIKHETKYTVALREMPRLFIERLVRPWLHLDWIYFRTDQGKYLKGLMETAQEFTNKIIQERKLERKNRKIDDEDNISEAPKRNAFLDHLLKASEDADAKMSDEDLRAEVDTFMFAGHDTTAAVMSFALFCIGNNPNVQEILDQELKSVFYDSEEQVTVQKLSELKYLERVVKETLRLFPSVPVVSRTITTNTSIGGYEIPTGSTLTINIDQIHRDPEYWSDPEKFDPDRFLPENSQGRHPFAYLPFSAGPRNCIGQKFAMLEAKTVLATVLRKWNVKSLVKAEELILLNEIVLTSKNGVQVYLTPKYD